MSENPQRPTPGRIVHYQTDGRNGYDYWLPAIVTITADDNWVPGDGTVPMPESEYHCHLNVLGPNGPYVEHNVPWNPDGDRRSWRWPERV